MAGPLRAHACGYFGKLPARADFVAARLRGDTVARWDEWLQAALSASQAAIGDTWREVFFNAPIWRFMLPAGTCGGLALVGVMSPSVDRVGRCFPLMIAHEFAGPLDPVSLIAGYGRWFTAAETLALTALRDDFDLAAFDALVPPNAPAGPAPRMRAAPRTEAAARAMDMVGTWYALPLADAAAGVLRHRLDGAAHIPHGIWWTTGASRFPGGLAISAGLVPCRGFPAMLDGLWERHGWSVAGGDPADQTAPWWSAPAAGGADWDRET